MDMGCTPIMAITDSYLDNVQTLLDILWREAMEAVMKFPRRYKFKTRRQYQLALRKWRVWNRSRIKEMERKVIGF